MSTAKVVTSSSNSRMKKDQENSQDEFTIQQQNIKPLEFVPAKTPESVSVKPSNYIIIAREGSSTSTSAAVSSDDDKESNDVVEYYGLHDKEHSEPHRKNSRISKTWNGVSTPITGLVNTGVTCFMNSGIQIMLHVPPLVHYLNNIRQGHYQNMSHARVTHDLADVLSKLVTKKRGFVPTKMLKNLDDVNCMMTPFQQQDSHEYFQSLLGRLQEESTPKGQKLNTSIVHDIFGGSLHQTIKCNSCGHVSTTYQDLYDLVLGFSHSLVKSVNDYFKDETMTNYTCDKCHKKTNALKKSSIEDAPEFLSVHVKRFKHVSDNKYHKEKGQVKFPLDLKLSKYSSKNEPIQYRLTSVLVHSGRSLSSGHYHALCRDSKGTWKEFDDDIVHKVSEQDVLNTGSVYMLMYCRLKAKPHGTGAKKPPVMRLGVKRSNEDSRDDDNDNYNDIDRIFKQRRK